MSVNELRINVASIADTATIYLSGHFAFKAHRDFKAAYERQLADFGIGRLIVNLAEVEYLDSSALGMLLVLRDHALAANKPLVLSSPSPIAVRTFDIAGFPKLFNIQ